MDQIKKLGMSYYRVDVQVNDSGIPVQLTWFNELLSKAAPRNIAILPMIYLQGLDTCTSESNARARGMAVGKGFSASFGSKVNYHKMGNEQDAHLLLKDASGNDQDGSHHQHLLQKLKA